MTSKEQALEFLEIHQQIPVMKSPYASTATRRRIQTDRMRLRRLSVQSIARYVQNGATRGVINEQFKAEGFVSYDQLVPVMRHLFPDIWREAAH